MAENIKIRTQREVNGLFELTESARNNLKNNVYYNDDLAPTKLSERTWKTYNIAALWVGMSVCIPTYMMASGLMAAGLSWWQAILNICLGNLIVLIPMQLNSHAGTKYGIPYPVFARLAFGIKGSHIASIARAVIAAGWFGIQCWIGGGALNAVIGVMSPTWAAWSGGIWVSFFIFWALNVWIAYKGEEAIKFMESWGAPILGVLSLGLMIWALKNVHALGKSVSDVLNMPATYKPGQFWKIFLSGLTANIAFWSTLALNIPDFSRYAKSQKDQFRGQLLGLPTTMAAFAFVGVFVTGATGIIFGEFLWDPVAVVANIGSPIAALLGAIGIAVATLTTNIAANVVAPANGISNLNPQKISYRTGALITGFAGVAIMPWKLLSSAGAYIFGWLGTYGLFLGPLAGMYIADYYIYRKKVIDLDDLFKGEESRYWYNNGFNKKAVYTWILAAILPLLGKVIPSLSFFAENGWIIGFLFAIVIYPVLMKNDTSSLVSAEEELQITERVQNPENA
ncbi:NCS1 family nucleobase:cation symporter-1 [Crassaminicella thermophila]|uniref:NCS1 family nucleobase:cation symporter-1 n=1 Tax=Crassaminicella thermophila TaxID=2599308 RepID=A0A5C0SB30_CRATE|nr:NCS1 family nucleobase:cation symporter-1 [Crassaminicella thermophila]QEK11793.1 NCS1 family nucleobase:cation symporter-1 [Crassaminicella thermophila]